MHDIQVWLLVLTLFLPRIGLLIAYCNSAVPYNTIPFWGDFFMTLFIPRILMLIYIGTNMGIGNPWFIVHAIVAVCVMLKTGSSCNCHKND